MDAYIFLADASIADAIWADAYVADASVTDATWADAEIYGASIVHINTYTHRQCL